VKANGFFRLVLICGDHGLEIDSPTAMLHVRNSPMMAKVIGFFLARHQPNPNEVRTGKK